MMDKLVKESNELTVIGLCGSLRPQSYTRMAVTAALQGAREAGAVTKLIDLNEYDLVFCRGKSNEIEYPENVFNLREEFSRTNGIILGTPEYHGSFSGVLKNAIDLMGFSEFESKIIGLVGVSGGKMGAANALNGLRVIGRSLHAWVLPKQVSIPEAWKVFDTSGEVKDSAIGKRLNDVGRQVARFAYLHTSEKALEFLDAWEQAPTNPGG
ncbi:NADPH-dependent FMN reductase [candidate division KSB1 bacterium]